MKPTSIIPVLEILQLSSNSFCSFTQKVCLANTKSALRGWNWAYHVDFRAAFFSPGQRDSLFLSVSCGSDSLISHAVGNIRRMPPSLWERKNLICWNFKDGDVWGRCWAEWMDWEKGGSRVTLDCSRGVFLFIFLHRLLQYICDCPNFKEQKKVNIFQ